MIFHNINPNSFVVFEAKLLRNIPGSGVKVGGIIYASLMPDNYYYLSKSGTVGSRILGRVFETEAVENVDFVRV
jgi:hypothetical protein